MTEEQRLKLDYSKIAKDYQLGKSQRQIANENNTCHKTIKRILSKKNIIVRPRLMLSKIIPEDILRDLYLNQNKSINEIAALTNSHHSVIKKNLIKLNIPLREYKEQLYINPSFLNKLNKIRDNIEKYPEFFYILGSFKGDGHYNIKRNRVEISVIDLDFLEEIKRTFNILSPETKISMIVSKEQTDTTQKLYRLAIYSSDFFNKKLHTLLPQTLEEKKFYLKGLYDAEGSIDKGKLAITLTQKNVQDLNLWESWLNELSIQTSRSMLTSGIYHWGVIRILGKESKINFYNLIGFRIKRKQERLERGIKNFNPSNAMWGG